MGDSVRDITKMVLWVGFKTGYLPVKHAERGEGTSGYNFFKLVKLASDFIIGFSNKPLLLVLQFGFIVFVISLAIALFYFIYHLVGGIAVSGFTTIVISLWLLGGIQIMIIGVVGLYIAKIFDNTKQRPLFIISNTLNLDETI